MPPSTERPTAPARPIRVYSMAISGHSHRVRLFLTLLGLPFETVEVDVLRGEAGHPEFLALNPFGQVPVIQDGELTLPDSNAILVYLARRYDPSGRWLPDDVVKAAQVQRWLSVAAGELADGPASARFACLIGRTPTPQQVKASHRVCRWIDEAVAAQPFLTGAQPTIADIALYSYTAHAPEGAITLEPYAHLRAWLDRIEALPGFIGMVRGAVPAPVAVA
jgi:glutathione S-transferase